MPKIKKRMQIKKSPSDKLQWFFPSTGHGEIYGFSDAQLEYFQGDHEKYIARETIQNAVDARLDYKKPVSVVFEYFSKPPSSLPGISELLDCMNRCLSFAKGHDDKAESFFKSAIAMLKSSSLPILKIRDFNTVGLSGADDAVEGHWFRLVRAAGTSSPKGVAGGSFGIGKGAPIAASDLRTVFYSSINDEGQSVFQGKARLISHFDESKDVRQGVGFYGINGYKAIRNPSRILEFFKRKERGTDIFIMGYKSEENWQTKLIRSILHNFWLTILHGDLEVAVKNEKEILITKDTLKDMLEEYDAEDAQFYFESVTNWSEKFEEELKHLGGVSLFVRKQDNYPSKIMMVRSPKMLVQEKSYRVLREPYAGVVICDDERGNRLLRDLEPPAHDKWDRDREDNGWAAMRELDDFIKQKLKSMGEAITSEPEDIPGLDRYLPDSEDREYIPNKESLSADPTELLSDEETGREVGAAKEPATAEIEKILRKGVVTKKQLGRVKPAYPEGEGDGKKGRPTGTEAGKEKGVRIKTSNISFRSFVQSNKSGLEYRLTITGRENCEGAIVLAAIGDDGSYPANINSAKDADTGKQYEIDGSMIKDLAVKKGEALKLAVELESKKKYALGIENYEG